ncbi:MAG: hypothetical protein KDA68_00650 [Planctomycetaceae bacterium]|nr:hypothetical protein [Planctomycetaceae bacterium]
MVPVSPKSETQQAKKGSDDALPSEGEASALSLRDVAAILRRRWLIVVGVTIAVLGGSLLLHWKFPPWFQANVYLKLGEEWGRAVQSEKQTLDDAYASNRAVLVERLMLEANVGPKPKVEPDEETERKKPVVRQESGPLVEWDLTTSSLDRCEIPENDPRRVVMFGKGKTPELAIAFLEHVADRIVAEHLKTAELYREKWKRRVHDADRELDRLATVRKNISAIETSGDREKALQEAALDLLEQVVATRGKEKEKALDQLKLEGDSMTCRTGTPKVLGPVGARTWPLVAAIGMLGGMLLGCVVGLLPDMWQGWKRQAASPPQNEEEPRGGKGKAGAEKGAVGKTEKEPPKKEK